MMKLDSFFSTACLLATCAVTSCNALSSVAVKKLTASPLPSLQDFDCTVNNRLPWIQEGYGTWKWRGHDINYLEMGDKTKPTLLLIHGFGASVYHFRHNIPDLARDYHVFAFDKLGFGLSSKPVQDYTFEIWRDQTLDFVKQVIGKPTTLVGNSIGGFTALYAAAQDKDVISGCVLLNAAGKFKDPTAPLMEVRKENAFVAKCKEALQRLVIAASFVYTKQPARIEQVLRQVYPVNAQNVDSELVQSIQVPSLDPNAAEVFYRVITRSAGAQVYIDDLLAKLQVPLLLCWGEQDPWIRSAAADKIQALYPESKRVSIDAGHCPHDEAPEAVNSAIREFIQEVHSQ